MRRHALALASLLAAAPAAAQDEKEEKKGTVVRIEAEKKVDEPAAPKLEAVGALAAPSALELDEGPVSEHGKTLTWIGFHQAKEYSRLFFKTTERAAVEVVPGNGVVHVKLKNTRARLRNNLRFLDTSYFPSAVWKVIPQKAGDDLHVEIQMREAVSYKVRRRMETIQIDFDLPAKK
jgi:hypothetical protein